jgi:predicted RNase H-like HicB family nuclease
MSGKSSKSSKKRRGLEPAVDGPFDPAIARRARQIAECYRLVLEPDPDVGFIGRGLEMPTVFADGPTADQCVRATREALTAAVATMLEMGLRPPAPAVKGARQAQINVRLTAEEKLILEDSARRAGFRGVSDFVRAGVLDFVRAAALSPAGQRPIPKRRTADSSRKRAKRSSKKSA